MILELDIGNTRAKWRLIGAPGQMITRGGGVLRDWLDNGLPDAWAVDIRRVRAAAVVGDALKLSFGEAVKAALGLDVEWARTVAEAHGVRNGYESPASLGVDRWLGLVAAYKKAGAAVVVDVGSALTVDLVDASGFHRGGYIVPGPRLMQDSLLRDTDRVRFAAMDVLGRPDFGLDTSTCVMGGIAAAQVGSVLVAIGIARDSLGGGFRVFLTGGWAAELARLLEPYEAADFVVAPDLVLDGLAWALP